ncbi:MAG: class I SAM-dependent methyltransferase [Kiritimatiellae bacterium]|nr:class I SAM-dependent methyltransferase [Kiritimatiellia bacterium]
MKRTFREWVAARLVDLLYPSIYLWPNAFKIYEYWVLMNGGRPASSDVVLDLGCGGGLHTYILAKRCRKAVGLDITEKWTRRAWQELHRLKPGMDVDFVCSPLEKAGFADASFDRIFSFSVLEHIPNYETVLRECLRVLKPGGSIHFSVDWLAPVHDAALIDKHRGDHGVVRYFSPKEMTDLLSGAGFADIRIGTFVRSPRAVRRFENGIRKKFISGHLRAWRDAWLLRWMEGCRSDPACPEAIYLHVRAVKPRGGGVLE